MRRNDQTLAGSINVSSAAYFRANKLAKLPNAYACFTFRGVPICGVPISHQQYTLGWFFPRLQHCASQLFRQVSEAILSTCATAGVNGGTGFRLRISFHRRMRRFVGHL